MYEQQLDKIEKASVYMSVYDVQFWHEARYVGCPLFLRLLFSGVKEVHEGDEYDQ